MSENEFMNALKEEMPEGFGRELLAQLKAEEKQKVKPFSAFWTVAAASIVTVLVGLVLFMSRMPNAAPLSMMQELWQSREPISPVNINLAQNLLTIGYGQAQAFALSPDNNTLAVATGIGIYLHDAHDLAAAPRFLGMPADADLRDMSFITGFRYLSYTADGRLFGLLTKPHETTLYQWDEASQSFLSIFTLGQPWLISQVVKLSPDGTKLLLGTCSVQNGMYGDFCQDGSMARIQIIDLVTERNIFFRVPQRMSNAIADVNSDWTQLIYEEASKIRLYDLLSGESQDLLLIGDSNGNRDQVMRSEEMHSLHFSPDGTQIGILDASNSPMDWWVLSDLQAHARTVRQYGTGMYSPSYYPSRPVPALNPIANEYIISSDFGLLVYDYGANRPNVLIPSDSRPKSYLMSSDGQSLYTLDNTGLLRIWDLPSQSLSSLSVRYATGSVMEFSFSADSQEFSSIYDYRGGVGFVYDISTANVQQSPIRPSENSYLAAGYSSFSPDGRYLVFIQDSKLWLYDRQEERTKQLSSDYNISHVAFRPNGDLISVSNPMNGYGTTQVYSAEFLATETEFSIIENEPIESVPVVGWQLSPDGTKLLVWHCDQTENADGTVPAPCRNGSLRLFDTFTWEEIAPIDAGISDDTIFANYFFSSDSQSVVLIYCDSIAEVGWSCNDNKTVLEFWNIAELNSSAAPKFRLSGLDNNIGAADSLMPYADGSMLLNSFNYLYDEEVDEYLPFSIFWEIQADGDYQELRRIPSYGASFAPDRSYFLTAWNGQIELWGVPANVASGN